jgi:hypothetical protein
VDIGKIFEISENLKVEILTRSASLVPELREESVPPELPSPSYA